MVDTPMLKKIKVIQLNEMKTWKGMQVEYISRPGKYLQNESINKFIDISINYFLQFINV